MSAEVITALSGLVEAVAWPIIFLLLLLTQRRRISALIASIETLTLPGGVKASFRRELEQEARSAGVDREAAKLPPSPELIDAANRIDEASLDYDFDVVRQEAKALAREYERFRTEMTPGSPRTRRMEVVISKMRTLGLAMWPLLDEFAASNSPGERLAAIATLQLRPDTSRLDWLAERLSVEKPFVAYHAAMALLVAVRTLGQEYKPQLVKALGTAANAIEALPQDADRTTTIRTAQQELERRFPA